MQRRSTSTSSGSTGRHARQSVAFVQHARYDLKGSLDRQGARGTRTQGITLAVDLDARACFMEQPPWPQEMMQCSSTRQSGVADIGLLMSEYRPQHSLAWLWESQTPSVNYADLWYQVYISRFSRAGQDSRSLSALPLTWSNHHCCHAVCDLLPSHL